MQQLLVHFPIHTTLTEQLRYAWKFTPVVFKLGAQEQLIGRFYLKLKIQYKIWRNNSGSDRDSELKKTIISNFGKEDLSIITQPKIH
jgi:hypothetical protein